MFRLTFFPLDVLRPLGLNHVKLKRYWVSELFMLGALAACSPNGSVTTRGAVECHFTQQDPVLSHSQDCISAIIHR